MFRPLAIVLGVVLWSACAIAQNTYYVDAEASGNADGSSWSDAFVTLFDATSALQPGDTLYSRGTFYETTNINDENITWIGDSDPSRPTWIRGDRYSDQWQPTGAANVYQLDGVSALIGTSLRPGSVVFDYKRDDLVGTVTGVDLSRHFTELPANGAGVYYGHLRRVSALSTLNTTPSSWYWDQANNRVYVHVPEGRTFDPAIVGVCINGFNGVSVWKGNVHITGVNTLCTPGFASNSGYGLKGLGTFGGGVFENADIIDSGWHASGYEIGSPYNCTLRNLRAWSSGVDGSNANNPFVFYSNVNRTNAGHVGEDLVFHAYPLLGTDGAPIYNTFVPQLAYSHSSGLPADKLGGIVWRRCIQYDYEAGIESLHGPISIGGYGISAGDLPGYTPSDPDSYPIQVEDCYVEGAGAAPRGGIAYRRTTFIPNLSLLLPEYQTTITSSAYLESCMIDLGRAGANSSAAFFDLQGGAQLFLDMCTINAGQSSPMQSIFRLGGASITARQCVFSSQTPISLMLVWPSGWDSLAATQSFEQCYYAGPITPAIHSWLAPRSQAWWAQNIDANAVFGPAGDFVDPVVANLRPVPGSTLDVARSSAAIAELLGLLDVDLIPYARSYGASQHPCIADTNHDTFLSPADFTAWIAAFNAQAPECDQNSDGLCTPADFTAWIANFNAGC